MPILIKELFALYAGHTLPPATPYRDFLDWLSTRDSRADEAAWRALLSSVDGPTLVGGAGRRGSPSARHALTAELDDTTSARVDGVARQHGLTANIVVQLAWAVLLGALTGRDDVVFGATVSGRPHGAARFGAHRRPADQHHSRTGPPRPAPVGRRVARRPARPAAVHAGPPARRPDAAPVDRRARRTLRHRRGLRELSDRRGRTARSRARPGTPGRPGAGRHALPADAHRHAGRPPAAAPRPQHRPVRRGGSPSPPRPPRRAAPPDRRGSSGEPGPASTCCCPTSGTLRRAPRRNPTRSRCPQPRCPTRSHCPTQPRCAARSHCPRCSRRTRAAWPTAPALTCGDTTLSYEELNARANRLARLLVARGAGPERLVALVLERSTDLVVAVLAVLKSG